MEIDRDDEFLNWTVDEMLVAGETTDVCRFCGCTRFNACVVRSGWGPAYRRPTEHTERALYCDWITTTRTLCSACEPAATAEAASFAPLYRLSVYRVLIERIKAAFHQGFVAGWFNVQGPRRRNPFTRAAALAEHATPYDWRPEQIAYGYTSGLRAGRRAAQQYRALNGPIKNVLRTS